MPTPSKAVLYTNARLFDPATGKLSVPSSLLIENGMISAIKKGTLKVEGLTPIDLNNKVLMPGLIDCHVHVVASSLNLGNVARMPNVLAAFNAVPIMEGMLKRGFTTVRDAGGADFAMAQATASQLVRGPRIFPSGKALSQTGGHGDFRGRSDEIEPCACSSKVGNLARVVDGVDAVRLAVRQEIQRGATQIKIMASGGVASPNDPIHALGYSEDEIRAIVEEAQNAGTYVMAHAYTPTAIERAVRNGVRSIEHGNNLDDASAAAMAKYNAFLVPTLITYDALANEGAALGLPPESVAKIESVRANGMRSLELARKHGVEIAFGSDLLGESHRHQSTEFNLRSSVLGNLRALQHATINAAKLLNQVGKLGVIAKGAHADFLVLAQNPVDDLKHLSAAKVIQNGSMVRF
jgi:imidazolonepropionase-like amidohydrolase